MVTHEDIFLNKCEDLWAWSGGGSQLCGDGRDSRPHSFFDPRFNRRLTDDLPLTQRIHCGRSHLPTFSSPAIEAHLHRIPGLSPKVRIMRTRASRCHARTHTRTRTLSAHQRSSLPLTPRSIHAVHLLQRRRAVWKRGVAVRLLHPRWRPEGLLCLGGPQLQRRLPRLVDQRRCLRSGSPFAIASVWRLILFV